MGARISQLLLLGIFIVLLMDEVIRFCNVCKYYDGYKCTTSLTYCWKFNVLIYNRSCRTDHFYFNDLLTGRFLYRYTKLSCDTCYEGTTQVFHDLQRETHCCNRRNFCNDPERNYDIQRKYGVKLPGDYEEEEDEDRVMYT